MPRHFFLELRVTHRQHLVDDEDFRFQVRRHGEGEPHIHAAGVMLHRRIEKHLRLGKGDDLVELAVDLLARHAKDRAVEINVLPAGQLRVKTGAHLEQAGDAALDLHPALRRLGDAAQNFSTGSTCPRRCGQ